MSVDLHTHSRYSDGSETPAAIIDAAERAGLSAIALTDHDLLDGLDEAAEAADGRIEFVPGTELSVEWRGKGMHLLTYWVTPDSPLAGRLAEIQRGRADRNAEMVGVLNDLGIEITMEELQAEAGYGVIGRPHFAAVLVRRGAVESIGAAFDQYLAAGRPAYRARTRIGAAEGIALARESGAVPVVAHPHTLGNDADDFLELLPEMRSLGVAGIESFYVEYPPDLRRRLATATRDLGLVATGGSDFHGSYKPGIEIGSGRGDLDVPDRCWEELAATRADI